MRKREIGFLSALRNERGVILLSTYLSVSMMMIFSLGIYFRTMNYMHTTERNGNRIVAFNLAESGVDVVIEQLSLQDSSQADNFSRYPCASGGYDQDGDGTAEGCSTAFTSMTTTGSTVQGGYQIWVTDPEGGNSEYRRIRVSGQTPFDGSATTAATCLGTNGTAGGYECRTVEAYVELDDTLFEHAVFSEGDLTFNGSSALVDSYDANLGAYGGANVGNNGDIGSNGSVADGSITLNGSPTINGATKENLGIHCNAVSVTPPIASMGTLRVNNNETLPTVVDNTYRYDSVTVQSNNGILNIGPTNPTDPNYGQPVTIYIDGDLKVNAGEIQAHSPVTFYVGGEVNIAGNGAATSNDLPSNFIIYATGAGDVSVSGGSEFFGAIYAPDSNVDINGGIDFYGGIFGTAFDGNGAQGIHYDQTLSDMKLPCTVVRFRSWREHDTLMS